MPASRQDDLERIRRGLRLAAGVLEDFTPGSIEARRKAGGDPVTEADLAVNRVLRSELPGPAEGWLSEETRDDPDRLRRRRVWVVDPIDGTREFVLGLPEWCVSIGLVEDGRAVAGGIFNPAADKLVLGSVETGVRVNGEPPARRRTASLADALVLASRSEFGRGEWQRFAGSDFEVRPMGSVAFKLALVAAGEADATWTLVPKHEWDVAAGVALVTAAGGEIRVPGDGRPAFNQEVPLYPGLVALAAGAGDLWRTVEARWVPDS